MPFNERFLNASTDFGFKKVFGSKYVIIPFLNDMLGGEKHITDLFYAKNEQLGRTSGDRRAILDISCVTSDGRNILVEMQQVMQQFFKDRGLYYVTFPIQDQAKKGNGWSYELKEVYVICLMDFVFDSDSYRNHPGQFLHNVQLVETQTGEVFYHKLTFIYIELPKFNKKEEELVTNLDKWLYLFKNLNKLGEIPLILQEAPFKAVFDIAEVSNLTKEEMTAYEASLKQKRDYQNTLDSKVQEGIRMGIEKGMEKGIEKGMEKGESRTLVIIEMLRDPAMTVEKIAHYTGASVEYIREIQKHLKSGN